MEKEELLKKIGKLNMERSLLRDENTKLTKENNQYLEIIHTQKEQIIELQNTLDGAPNCDECDLAGSVEIRQAGRDDRD